MNSKKITIITCIKKKTSEIITTKGNSILYALIPVPVRPYLMITKNRKRRKIDIIRINSGNMFIQTVSRNTISIILSNMEIEIVKKTTNVKTTIFASLLKNTCKIIISLKPKRVNLSVSLADIQRVTTRNKLLPFRIKNTVRNEESMKISLNTVKNRSFERSKTDKRLEAYTPTVTGHDFLVKHRNDLAHNRRQTGTVGQIKNVFRGSVYDNPLIKCVSHQIQYLKLNLCGNHTEVFQLRHSQDYQKETYTDVHIPSHSP